jgi:uncharacterized protein (TIGR03118 family)
MLLAQGTNRGNKRISGAYGWGAVAAAAIVTLAGGAAAAPAVAAVTPVHPPTAPSGGYREIDLISDTALKGTLTDPKVVNPWGIALGPTTPLWVANNGSSTATLYTGANGKQRVSKVPLTLTLPKGPTGQVFNNRAAVNPRDFVVQTGRTRAAALFLFDSLGGQLAGWTRSTPLGTSAQVKATVPQAEYTGLAEAHTTFGNLLFAANMGAAARVDVFDAKFRKVFSFADPSLKGLRPYNVAVLGGNLYVSFAPPEGSAATPHGAIDVVSLSGHGVRRLVTGGPLSGPWGMVIAPMDWGRFGGDLLVGNEDGGQINAFDVRTGKFRGTVSDTSGKAIAHDGLWGLAFGNGTFGTPHSLIFVAGVGEYQHGLIGLIEPVTR